MLAATHVAEQERMHLGATAGVIDVPLASADDLAELTPLA